MSYRPSIRRAWRIVASCAASTPRTAIIEAVEDGDYDLVVMGTHGRTGVVHALLGSVAEQVVQHASCPVLTVRPKE